MVGDVDSDATLQDTLHTVAALMRAFSKAAIVVAGRYTHAHSRNVVTGADMRAALMYCARTFFETEDAELTALVEAEMAEMHAEDSADETEGSDGTETEGSDAEDEEEVYTGTLPEEADVALARHVDAIVAAWPLWTPDDPVHVLIKRAIDQTSVE